MKRSKAIAIARDPEVYCETAQREAYEVIGQCKATAPGWLVPDLQRYLDNLDKAIEQEVSE